MAKDTITLDVAGEIDNAWVNAGQPRDGLRIVGYRTAGNGMTSMLCCPGDEWAPVYRLTNGVYTHVNGMTLAQWQQNHAYADLKDTEASARW